MQIWQDLYARYGMEFPLDEWVRTVVGSTVSNLDPVARLEKLSGQSLNRRALHDQAARIRLDWQTSLQPMPGVADYLDSARRLGLLLAVASSSPHSRVDPFVQHLGLFDLFDAVVCREDVTRLKPFPDLFLAALSSLHLPPGQALAFEDSPNGIRAAQAAGLRVVGVPNSITARLGPLPADLALASLSDIPLPDVLTRFGDTLAFRSETPDDLPGIRLVENATFDRHAEASLVDLARARGKVNLSLVADQDGSILGHILFTPVTFAPPQPHVRGLGIGPVAVLPKFQRTGIGSRLMRAGLDHVRRLGYAFAVLLGDPVYYSRFGFKPARSFGLTSEYGSGDEFQVRELFLRSLTGVTGHVKYIPEFAETDL